MIVVICVAIVLLFVSMVLSAISSSDSSKGDMEKAKKMSTAAAVVTGLGVGSLFISLGLYFWYHQGGALMASMRR